MQTEIVNSSADAIPETRREVFASAPDHVGLREASLPASLADGLLIETAYSVISPGTERAVVAGIESWAPLPYVPGYGAVGRVVRGDPDWGLVAGDLAFTFGPHASLVGLHRLAVPLPAGIDLRHAALARMAMVAMPSLRIADIELGDWVVVVGAGLVGQFAAQLCRLQGGRVIVVDLDQERLAVAQRCGAEAVIVGGDAEAVIAGIRAVTGGELAGTVIEATGVTDLIAEAIRYAAEGGELILLGSPRAAFSGDALPVFRDIHLGPHITVKGGIEWQLPDRRHPGNAYKHSLERNVAVVMQLIASGRLHCEELITSVLHPDRCTEVYAQMAAGPQGWLGVLFDWTAVED